MLNFRLGTVNARSMRDKAAVLSDLVVSERIDPLGITETWLIARKTSADLAEVTPAGFSFFQIPRAKRRGGGIGLFVSSAYKFTRIILPAHTSFESKSGNVENYYILWRISGHSVLHVYTTLRFGADEGFQSSR